MVTRSGFDPQKDNSRKQQVAVTRQVKLNDKLIEVRPPRTVQTAFWNRAERVVLSSAGRADGSQHSNRDSIMQRTFAQWQMISGTYERVKLED